MKTSTPAQLIAKKVIKPIGSATDLIAFINQEPDNTALMNVIDQITPDDLKPILFEAVNHYVSKMTTVFNGNEYTYGNHFPETTYLAEIRAKNNDVLNNNHNDSDALVKNDADRIALLDAINAAQQIIRIALCTPIDIFTKSMTDEMIEKVKTSDMGTSIIGEHKLNNEIQPNFIRPIIQNHVMAAGICLALGNPDTLLGLAPTRYDFLDLHKQTYGTVNNTYNKPVVISVNTILLHLIFSDIDGLSARSKDMDNETIAHLTPKQVLRYAVIQNQANLGHLYSPTIARTAFYAAVAGPDGLEPLAAIQRFISDKNNGAICVREGIKLAIKFNRYAQDQRPNDLDSAMCSFFDENFDRSLFPKASVRVPHRN